MPPLGVGGARGRDAAARAADDPLERAAALEAERRVHHGGAGDDVVVELGAAITKRPRSEIASAVVNAVERDEHRRRGDLVVARIPEPVERSDRSLSLAW